jgi:CARDB
MRRALPIAVLALLALPATAEAASVRLVECVPALAPTDRSATFEARVHPVRGSVRMQVRFTLQRRRGGIRRWERVPAAEEWHTSFPDVRRYTYSRTVRNLTAPASYRTVVRFRWLDVEGEVIRRGRAASRACRQPDMRPDLAVTAIAPVAGGYDVALRNRGRSAAGPFDVTLATAAEALGPATVDGLAAGEQSTVFVAGPLCSPGEPLTAVADAGGVVDERSEDDNALVVPCGG